MVSVRNNPRRTKKVRVKRRDLKRYYDLPVGPLTFRFNNPLHTLNSIKNRFGSAVSKVKSWGELHAFFDILRKGVGGKLTVKAQLEEYRSWVHIATSVIYRRVSEIDCKFFRNDTDEQIKPGNPAYKILRRLFDNPNPFMDFRQLKAFTQLQLDLTGKAFILRIDDTFGKPMQLWPLPVDWLYEIKKAERFVDWIDHFHFVIDGEHVAYRPENILYFHYPHPRDPRDGMSPIQSQAYAIDVDHYIEVYERDYFKHSARPDFLIQYPEEVQIGDEEEAERIKANWKKSFSGDEGGFHNIGILDSGGKIEQLTPKNKDLDLMFLANWAQEKVLAAYNVPPGKVGMVKDVNRANAVGIDISFNSECVLPRLMLFDAVFTKKVTSLFDERIYIKHNNPIPRDREQDIKEIEKKVGTPMWTINEAREIEGKTPVEGGDEVLVPLNHMPLSVAVNNTPVEEPEEEPTGPDEDNDRPEPDEDEDEAKEIVSKDFSYPEMWRVKRWYSFKAFTEAWEAIYKNALRNFFEMQQEEVIQNLTRRLKTFESVWNKITSKYSGWNIKKVADDISSNIESMNDLFSQFKTLEEIEILVRHIVRDSKSVIVFSLLMQKQQNIEGILFDWDDNYTRFERTFRQFAGQVMQESGDEELALLGMDLKFDLENEQARRYLGEKVEEFSRNALSTKYNQLHRTLVRGFSAGENVNQLTDRVKGVYQNILMGGYDAERIARTEVISSSNAGRHLAYEQSGVVEEKEWLSVKDQRTRGAEPKDPANHLSMDKQRVPIYESFVDSRTGARLMQPGDTSLGAGPEDVIFCRCTLVPHTTRSSKYSSGPGIREVKSFQRNNGMQGVSLNRVKRCMEECY